MSEKSLFNLVNSAMNDDENNKVLIGYTVSSYMGVLSALEKAQQYSEVSGTNVLGMTRVDYSSVGTMSYNSQGFSTDPSIPVWKMQFNVVGAIPVQKDNWYEIVKFPNDSVDSMNRLGNKGILPLTLSQDIANNFPYDNFSVGAFIDLSNLAVKYFDTFYRKADSESFDETMIAKLIASGCLQAQIIFPQKNKTNIVTVIGQTPISKNACFYVTTPLLGASGWEDCGITVWVSENNQNKQELLPNGSTYSFPAKGEIYYKGKGTMGGMTLNNYKSWVERSRQTYGGNIENSILTLSKQTPVECFVQLFVPLDKKDAAMQYLPKNVSEKVFTPYGGKIIKVQQANEQYTGDIATIIANTAIKWATVRTNSGNGSINYSREPGIRPATLERGKSWNIISENGTFTPIFGHPNNLYNLDCSSLVACILFDTGIIRDDVTCMRAWASGEWASSAVNEINAKIKDQYEAKFMDLTDSSQIQAGDILIVTAAERGQSCGHVALAIPEGGMIYTIEIGSSKGQRPLKVHYGRTENNYYKHLIRIVEKVKTA